MRLLARYGALALVLGLVAFGCSEEPELLQAPATGPLTSALTGTETLGDPGIALATGTGIAIGGIGLRDGQPATLNVAVPNGATIKQVLLYWEGHMNGNGVDTQVTVGGTTVNGTIIGGPTLFYMNYYSSTGRADITGLGVVHAGTNSISVGGLNYTKPNGMGIVVIYDDGSGAAQIKVKDGNDCAYYAFSPPLNTTVPQTFTFTSAPVQRQAQLALLAGSVEPNRPNIVRVTINGSTEDYFDVFNNGNGRDFDADMLTLTIPAGASQVTVQCLSQKDPRSTKTGQPASLSWICGALSVPPPPLAELGDFVWLDGNCDGIQDAAENGVSGVTVYLFECGETEPLASTTTNQNGYYYFKNLVAGDYSVMFVLPEGYEFSPRNVGANDAVDSDALPTSGMTECTTLTAGEIDYTWDAGLCVPVEVIHCRMTGGANSECEETIPRGGNGPNINVYDCGGQAGAPTALQPQPWGEWTHTQKRGPAGSFTFHAGTASAPPETEIDWITCSDPGWCVHARPAPARQIDFAGVGTFHNMKNCPPSISDFVTVGESLHWFEVNVDDLGEPGKAGQQEPPPAFCDPTGYGRNGSEELADCDCPDFYRIRIWAGPDESSSIIYEAYGYIQGGNFQIHPLTGRDRKDLEDNKDGKGGHRR